MGDVQKYKVCQKYKNFKTDLNINIPPPSSSYVKYTLLNHEKSLDSVHI